MDVEGDGDQDILIGMTGAISDPKLAADPKPYVIENLGNNQFQISSKWASGSPQVAGWINNLVAGDFNEDGINDVLVVDHGREDKPYSEGDFAQPTLYLSSSSGWIQTSSTIQTANGWTITGKDFWHGSINSRDFNGDGHLDIVMTALGRAGLELWLGDGKGNFSDLSSTYLPNFIDKTASKVGGGWASFGITGFIDAGGDGKQDIFALPYAFSATNSNGYIALNAQAGQNKYLDLGNVARDPAIVNNTNRGYSEALVYDFDGNGLEDIIALAEASNGQQEGVMYLLYLSQDRPNEFNDKTVERFGSYSSINPKVTPRGSDYPGLYYNGASTEFSLGDYNGDGYMDINLGFPFLGRWDALNQTIFLNDGRGNFSRTFEINVEGGTYQYSSLRTDGVGDINRDGYADFFIVDSQSSTAMLTLLLSNPANLGANFLGSDLSESLKGNNLNNKLQGGGGNDAIDGGNGIDIAIYSGTAASHRISMNSGFASIIDTYTSRDGIDTLTNIERLQFSDKNIALDLAPTQAAGQTALLIGAVLPGKLVYDVSKQALLGSVIGLFDQNFTLAQLSGAILRLPIWDVLTGKAAPTNADIASYLVNNIYSGTQTAAITSAAISAMNAETPATQGNYLASLASSAANQAHIDLVGIQSTGLVYLG